MTKVVKLFNPSIHQESIDNVVEVLKSGWIGLGPLTEQFEQEFAKMFGCKYAVALNSGTAALQIATNLACNGNPHGFVITTPMTFVSTNHVIYQEGLTPVFADIDYFTGNIDPKSIGRILEDPLYKLRTKAIMVVHYAGQPVDLEEIYECGMEHGIPIIEDAAHACGASYKGSYIGSNSRFTAFSFHAVKNLCVGDGGLLTTDDEVVYQEARKLRWLGISKSTADRVHADKYAWDYDCSSIGYKSHMNDITAAIALGQMPYLQEGNSIRGKLVMRYRENLFDYLSYLSPLRVKLDRKSSNHIFAVLFNTEELREKVMQALIDNNIQYGVHYRPTFEYGPYKSCHRDNDCVNARAFWKKVLSLPLHLDLTMEDVDRICSVIGGVVKYVESV